MLRSRALRWRMNASAHPQAGALAAAEDHSAPAPQSTWAGAVKFLYTVKGRGGSGPNVATVRYIHGDIAQHLIATLMAIKAKALTFNCWPREFAARVDNAACAAYGAMPGSVDALMTTSPRRPRDGD